MNQFNLSDSFEDKMQAVHDYLGMWRDQEGYSDLNLMLDKGLTELAAYTLVNAGAIDSEICFDWVKPTERFIEELVKDYSNAQRDKDYKEFWINTRCFIDSSNEHYFINSEIHFVTDEEIKEYGWKVSN